MGVYSTLTISRKDALREIQSRLLDASNKEIGECLFELTCNHTFNNYWVVDTNDEVHAEYCCEECGCNDGDEECPVVKKELKQLYQCPHTAACKYEKVHAWSEKIREKGFKS